MDLHLKNLTCSEHFKMESGQASLLSNAAGKVQKGLGKEVQEETSVEEVTDDNEIRIVMRLLEVSIPNKIEKANNKKENIINKVYDRGVLTDRNGNIIYSHEAFLKLVNIKEVTAFPWLDTMVMNIKKSYFLIEPEFKRGARC